MNKQIPTVAGFVIILVVAAAFLSIFVQSYTSYEETADFSLNQQLGIKESSDCKPRAFSGEARIKGWYTNDGSQKMFQIVKDDASKLPINNIGKVRLVDADSDVEKKLEQSTEKKPGEITITGFADLCNGVTLASLSYEEGIFRPFLKN